jgi:hypothetical protein
MIMNEDLFEGIIESRKMKLEKAGYQLSGNLDKILLVAREYNREGDLPALCSAIWGLYDSVNSRLDAIVLMGIPAFHYLATKSESDIYKSIYKKLGLSDSLDLT